MIKSPKLKYDDVCVFSNYETRSIDSGTWEICEETLRQYFNIPRNVQHIQFYAYKEAAPDRTPITFLCRHPNDIFFEIEGDRQFIVGYTMYAIKRLTGAWKEWHVVLYYWE